MTETVFPLLDPNQTVVAPVNPPPLTVTDVPPVGGPLAGATADTAGGGKVNLKESTLVVGVVPPGVVTEILTVPAACSGAVATSWEDDLLVNDWAVVVPNLTPETV